MGGILEQRKLEIIPGMNCNKIKHNYRTIIIY